MRIMILADLFVELMSGVVKHALTFEQVDKVYDRRR